MDFQVGDYVACISFHLQEWSPLPVIKTIQYWLGLGLALSIAARQLFPDELTVEGKTSKRND